MILKLLSYNIRFGGLGERGSPGRNDQGSCSRPGCVSGSDRSARYRGIGEAVGFSFWGARADHSIGFISSVEIAHYEWHRPRLAKHTFLEIVPDGSDVNIFGLHLSARFSKWSERRRATEIRALLTSIEKHREGFHVLTGDFNALAPGALLDTRRMPLWIRTLIFISGRNIRRDTIQIMLDGNYIDGYRRLHPDRPRLHFPNLGSASPARLRLHSDVIQRSSHWL